MPDSSGPGGYSGPDEAPGSTRHKIQHAALELFTTQGFEKTSLREIAEQLGVTKAALYYHFPSKADLIRSLVQPLVDDIDAMMLRVDSTAASHPREIFADIFDTLLRHLPIFAALIRDASAFAYVDLEQRASDWIEKAPILLIGPEAGPDQRVRAIVAFSGLTRAAIFTLYSDIDGDTVRSAAIDAACAALQQHTAE